ncbi:hypothetical protein EDB19DRAFT_302998 [Suillus lakei]|nr:hypothetical protein EDB19DRAFT_302998 [Suillus lakei]
MLIVVPIHHTFRKHKGSWFWPYPPLSLEYRIPALKALFIPNVSGTNIPPAPDGQPPLTFVMNTAGFLGTANSPIGLIIPISALTRMSIPRGRWTSLPLGAIGVLAVGKQLITPVFGILVCEGFTRIGFIGAEDNVLRFRYQTRATVISRTRKNSADLVTFKNQQGRKSRHRHLALLS